MFAFLSFKKISLINCLYKGGDCFDLSIEITKMLQCSGVPGQKWLRHHERIDGTDTDWHPFPPSVTKPLWPAMAPLWGQRHHLLEEKPGNRTEITTLGPMVLPRGAKAGAGCTNFGDFSLYLCRLIPSSKIHSLEGEGKAAWVVVVLGVGGVGAHKNVWWVFDPESTTWSKPIRVFCPNSHTFESRVITNSPHIVFLGIPRHDGSSDMGNWPRMAHNEAAFPSSVSSLAFASPTPNCCLTPSLEARKTWRTVSNFSLIFTTSFDRQNQPGISWETAGEDCWLIAATLTAVKGTAKEANSSS